MVYKAFVILLCSSFIMGCSTHKNTFVHRGFHNLTNRFNGYYYSCENINEGIYKIEKNHKALYDQLLPVFIFPNKDDAKTTFPEFDKAIKKSSICIQRHTIKNENGQEIPEAGKWIDNNWINIGIAHFYKHELFSAIENFDYVIRTYTQSQDRYWAMYWICRVYHELGSTVSSEPYLNQLKSSRHLPKALKHCLPALIAEFYIKRNQPEEAAKCLQNHLQNQKRGASAKSKMELARLAFICGQLFEQMGNLKAATRQFEWALKLKPNFELEFYATIRLCRMPAASDIILAKTRKKLLKMISENKNTEYADVIYYTLGLLEERSQNDVEAVSWFKKSVRVSQQNTNQKGLSYMKLGAYYYKKRDYMVSGFYYDSTVQFLSKTHPEYIAASLVKKTLKQLIFHTQRIETTDSLQKLAQLPEPERTAQITQILQKQQKAIEEQRNAAVERNKTLNTGFSNTNGGNTPFTANAGTFYFYNPNTVAIGIAEFSKKWGNRPLEPQWRRSNKTIQLKDELDTPVEIQDNTEKPFDIEAAVMAALKQLPLTDSLMQAGKLNIIKSYYELGLIYKEELKDYNTAKITLETLNKRFSSHIYLPQSLFLLYNIYNALADEVNANRCKMQLTSDFPDSEYAKRLLHPELFLVQSVSNAELLKTYNNIYNEFKLGHCENVLRSSEAFKKESGPFMAAELQFLNMLCSCKNQPKDTLVNKLNHLIKMYPKTKVAEECTIIINGLQNFKTYEAINPIIPKPVVYSPDSMYFFKDTAHSVIMLLPDKATQILLFKQRLMQFNSTYYSNATFSISTMLFNSEKQALVVHGFNSADQSVSYYKNINSETTLFTEPLNKQVIDIWPIADHNIKVFYKRKSINQLQEHFNTHYLRL